MSSKHHIYLISDSTGETIDRIFLAIKAQFQDFEYEDHQYSFTRTENQIMKMNRFSSCCHQQAQLASKTSI